MDDKEISIVAESDLTEECIQGCTQKIWFNECMVTSKSDRARAHLVTLLLSCSLFAKTCHITVYHA